MAFAQLFLENNKVEAFQGKNPKETEETKKQVFEEIKRFKNSSSTWRTNSTTGSVAQEFENLIPDLITMTTKRPLLILLGNGSVVRTAGLAGKAPQTRPILIFLENDHYKAVGREQGVSLAQPLLATMIQQNTLFLTPEKANELYFSFNVFSLETSSSASSRSTSSCEEYSRSETSSSSDDEMDSSSSTSVITLEPACSRIDLEPEILVEAIEPTSSVTAVEPTPSVTALEPTSSVIALEPTSSLIGSEPASNSSLIASEPASESLMIDSEPVSSQFSSVSKLKVNTTTTFSVEKCQSEMALASVRKFDSSSNSSSTSTSTIASKSTSQSSSKSDFVTTQTFRSNSKQKSRSKIGRKVRKGFVRVLYLISLVID
jgi:hypothetical protein